MVLAAKAACAGIAFLLLTIGTSGPRPTTLASQSNLSREGPAEVHPKDLRKIQETLRDKGHYRGKADGVFGLRTQASIRAYQKAENLPVTGEIDTNTAGKLGITAEVRDETSYETTQGKPSAGIKSAKASGRTRNTLRKAAKTVAASESGQGDRERKLQAENDSPQQ